MQLMKVSDIKRVKDAQRTLFNAFREANDGLTRDGVDYSVLYFIEEPDDILVALDDIKRLFTNEYETIKS